MKSRILKWHNFNMQNNSYFDCQNNTNLFEENNLEWFSKQIIDLPGHFYGFNPGLALWGWACTHLILTLVLSPIHYCKAMLKNIIFQYFINANSIYSRASYYQTGCTGIHVKSMSTLFQHVIKTAFEHFWVTAPTQKKVKVATKWYFK